jgi:secondary thiamine-phosphate synthase enzyme
MVRPQGAVGISFYFPDARGILRGMGKPAVIKVRSSRRVEIIDITDGVARAIADSGMSEGICVLQSLHTTAALTINESADPDVRRDMERQLALIAPRDPSFLHAEGNSDAHIKTSLLGPTLTVIVSGGRALLGTWQAIYFCEFDGPRERSVVVKCAEV